MKLYYFMLFLFAKIKMIPECWEPLKGFPTLWKTDITLQRVMSVFYMVCVNDECARNFIVQIVFT
ncbi:hypothetical protein J2N67_006155 (plasmid) [Bacillus thuringiensis]|nr:hypothetical protein J2N67_006155 [Bacillus thuringiensis]